MKAPLLTLCSAPLAMVFLIGAGAALAAPSRTLLLEDDTGSNTRKRIDDATVESDALLEDATVESGTFSTRSLDEIDGRLRGDLQREHLRAPARLISYFYPGAVTPRRLRSLTEIPIDVELTVDPCERAVCHEAIARQIEIVGDAIGNVRTDKDSYALAWQSLTLKAVVPLHPEEMEVFRLPMGECIEAHAHGGMLARIDEMGRMEKQYEPIVIKSIVKHAAASRVSLVKPPTVTRSATEVTVLVRARGDRSRMQQQAIDALGSAAAALREHPGTPHTVHLEVALDIPMHELETRRFKALGEPVGLYLDGKLDALTLWDSYVEEVKKGAGVSNMTFDDEQ